MSVENLNDLPEIKKIIELRESGKDLAARSALENLIEKVKAEIETHEEYFSLYCMLPDTDISTAMAKHLKNERILKYLENKKSSWIVNSMYEFVEPLPIHPHLEFLTQGTNPVLRKWTGGKYKCKSLEVFIKAYGKLEADLRPSLIRDYLISDKTGKPYTDKNIEQRLKEYRI